MITRNLETVSFRLNTVWSFANKHTKHIQSLTCSLWTTLYLQNDPPKQDLGMEHSMLQSVTTHLSFTKSVIGCCVKNDNCSLLSLEWKSMNSISGISYHHHTTTVLRPFFRDHPGEPVPEENFWTLWCKGRLTEADTHDYLAGRHSVQTNQYPLPPSPHIFQCFDAVGQVAGRASGL